MAGSQQSPKVKKGERNSKRTNGKAPKKRQFGDFGQPLTGKGKPSGKSVVGISLVRVVAMAQKRHISISEMKNELIKKRDEKKAARKARGTGYKARLADRAKLADRPRPGAGS